MIHAVTKAVLFFAVAFQFSFASAHTSKSSDSPKQRIECEMALHSKRRNKKSDSPFQTAATKFQKFFSEIEGQLYERNFFLDLAKLALLAKEHVLMLGPPGNAKSMGVDLIIDNIVDDLGQTSVFKIQMTPETSLSETHGVIDYKKITEENIQTRKWEQGLLSAKLVFIDEFFDARANAIRNNLMALNEREHAQGRERIKGETLTGFAASNKYINEVYDKAGDDGPKAIIDRFAFVAFVPGEVESVETVLSLLTGTGGGKITPLLFSDLALLQEKVNEVLIPNYVAKILALSFKRMKARTEALEEGDKKRYLDQKRSGQNSLPPYRATKYFSPRTLRKAGKVLRAIVVMDYIQSGGKRSLVANSRDIEKLKQFFTLNSSSEEFLAEIEENTVNPNEKVQVTTALQEGQIFTEIYQEIMDGLSADASILTELELERENATTATARTELVQKMVAAMVQTVATANENTRFSQLGTEEIVADYIKVTLEEWLREILGDEYDSTVSATLNKIEQEKQDKLAALRKAQADAQKAELNERKRREAEQRRIELEARKRADRAQKMMAALGDGSKFTVLAENPRASNILTQATVAPGHEVILSLDPMGYISILNLIDGQEPELQTTQFSLPIHHTDIKNFIHLRDKSFLIWEGRYGHLFHLDTGFEKKKQIYELEGEQLLSQNSVDGRIAMLNRSEMNITLIDPLTQVVSDPSPVVEGVGINATDSNIEENIGSYIPWQINNSALHLTLSKDAQKVILSSGSFNRALSHQRYVLDLEKRRMFIDRIADDTWTTAYQSSEALNSGSFPWKERKFLSVKSDEQHQLMVSLYENDGRLTNLLVNFPDAETLEKFENLKSWDISPDRSFMLASSTARELFYLDMKTGEVTPITGIKVDHPIDTITFLDQDRVLLHDLSKNLRVIKLPVIK